jgi:translation elongation factor EF-Tu-like GTPase
MYQGASQASRHVGTVGHIDHRKTTLTTTLSARSAHGFPGIGIVAVDYGEISKGVEIRDDTKMVTIIDAHVEYELITDGSRRGLHSCAPRSGSYRWALRWRWQRIEPSSEVTYA